MEPNALDYINRGFDFILPVLQHFICTEFRKKDTANWWQKFILPELDNHGNFPQTGSFDDLKKNLDIFTCLKLIQKTPFVFKPPVLSPSQRSHVGSLMTWRTEGVAHRSDPDVFSYVDAENALDVQISFIQPIDQNTAIKIKNLRKEVFKRINPPKVSPNANIKYYIISINNKNTEHLTLSQIKSRIKSGTVTEGYYICQEGLDTNNSENWKKIDTIPELKRVFVPIEKKPFSTNEVKRPNQRTEKKNGTDANQKSPEKEDAGRKKQAEAKPVNPEKTFYSHCSEYYGKYKYDQVIDECNEALKANPDYSSLVYFFLGLSYAGKFYNASNGIERKEFKKEALNDLQRALLDLRLDTRLQVMAKTKIKELDPLWFFKKTVDSFKPVRNNSDEDDFDDLDDDDDFDDDLDDEDDDFDFDDDLDDD
ncbi:MAG: hypothetical protein LBU57_00020 [Dysgonamonadaceae bacterium]|jgi:hypothetical protein|nr:hypothetical protein [Dysgonamonadaceae bacterium]